MSRPGGWAQHSAFVKKSEPSPRSPQQGAGDRQTPTEVRRNGLDGPHLVLRTGGTGPASRTWVVVLPRMSAPRGRHSVLSSRVWGTGIPYILKHGIHSIEKDKSTSNRRCHILIYQREHPRGPRGSRPRIGGAG